MPFNRHKRKNIEGIQLHKYVYKCWYCGCELGSGSKPKKISSVQCAMSISTNEDPCPTDFT